MSNQAGDIVWVCGRWRAVCDLGSIWEFQGVFASEAEAVQACKSPAYWVAPYAFGTELPQHTQGWEGCYYPSERRESP